jgi:hypothetical protein
MEDHETRRKIIRQWMSRPKHKRAEQAVAFAKKASEENENFSAAVVTHTKE